MSATFISTSCCSASFCPYVCIARPNTISAVFLNALDGAAFLGHRAIVGRRHPGRPEELVLQRPAAAMIGTSPLTARFASMPGISRRLISLVPSKMRLTRASR